METETQLPGVVPGTLARGRNGCVSCAHPAAAQVGLECLRTGGNAFDALVSMSWALTVVEPTMSGLFGVTTVLARSRDGETRWRDAAGIVPAALDREKLDQGRALKSPAINAMVPTLVNANALLLEDLGTRSLSDTLEPAIRLAEHGVDVSDATIYWLEAAEREQAHALPPCFQPANLERGRRLKQPQAARALRTLASDGTGSFVSGEPARAIVASARAAGSLLELEDLARRPLWSECISTSYRDLTLFGPSPPNGTFEIFLALALLERCDLRSIEPGSAEYYHLLAEAMKRSATHRIRSTANGTPSTQKVMRLLGEFRDPSVTEPLSSELAIRFGGLQWSPTEMPPRPRAGHTSHLAAIDADGNAACATQTLGGLCGCNVWADGWGIPLNGVGTYLLASEPEAPLGLQPVPGQPALSILDMVIAERDGEFAFSMGSPGGFIIPCATLQGIVAMADHGFDPQRAAEFPRCAPIKGVELNYEERIDTRVLEELRRRGHDLRAVGDWSWRMGGLHPVAIDPDNSDRLAGADPRRRGVALASCDGDVV